MFQAGFARVDVTPPLGSPLAGYPMERLATKIWDPLELNCVSFFDGENKAVLITSDFLYVMESAATPIRKMISEKCDIPMENVFMQGLHQHTSIRVGSIPDSPYVGIDDKAYLDLLYRKYCDVVSLALLDLKDATFEVAEEKPEKQYTFIRRFYMKDGSLQTNPKDPEQIDRPADEADNMVRLVRVKRENGKDIAIANYSAHPDSIGGRGLSADWCGFVRRLTEKEMPDTHCILVNGPQGDSVTFDWSSYKPGMKVGGYQHAEDAGRSISNAVISLWKKTKPIEVGNIWGKVVMKYVPSYNKDYERFQECEAALPAIRAGENALPEGFTSKEQVFRIMEMKHEKLFQKVPVSVLCLGKLGFVGFGGEPFTEYARKARKAGKDMYIISACLTNGGQGYLPTAKAFGEGGYETSSSQRYTPAVEEIITGAAAALLEEYQAKK
ncbi:MAG: hypothetical protein IKU24_01750 [Clostridia bacterium]|nr:hypothetical protein [Clostridia bacterium]